MTPKAPITSGTGIVTVVATKAGDSLYFDSAATALVAAARANQAITFNNPGDQISTNTLILIATASSRLPVGFSVVSGPATLSGGSNLTFSATGQVSVAANQAGDANWNPAQSVTNTFTVTSATAALTLTNLNQAYNGGPIVVTATTVPAGLAVVVTYNGSPIAPSNVGSYTVTGIVNDAFYTASAVGTLVIAKGVQTIVFTDPGNQSLHANVILQAQASSGLPVQFVVLSGPGIITSVSNLSFTGIGNVLVAARQNGNANWNAAPQVLVTIKVGNLAINDYDGDGISDLAVFTAAGGTWNILYSSGGATNFPWGFLNSTPVCGDYDGDGKADPGVFYDVTGRWYIRSMSGATLAYNFKWGFPGASAVAGDYDGDGRDDLAVYDENTGKWFIWSLAKKATLVWNLGWGFPGAKPVSGDYDGDGASDLAVLDINAARWYIYSLANHTGIAWNLHWGWADFGYIPGDFDGDGRSDLTVYDQEACLWYVYSLATRKAVAWKLNWGFAGGMIVSGDYDGDALTDFAVFNPATGKWYIRNLAKTILEWGKMWGGGAALPVKP